MSQDERDGMRLYANMYQQLYAICAKRNYNKFHNSANYNMDMPSCTIKIWYSAAPTCPLQCMTSTETRYATLCRCVPTFKYAASIYRISHKI